MTTFVFDLDGNLVPWDKEAVAYNNAGSYLPTPPLTLDYLNDMHDRFSAMMDRGMGSAPLLMVNPKTRTAAAIEQQVAQSLPGMQKMENALRSHILDMMRVTMNEYVPKTVRRQFRFPRSKKKRIQKKWAKDQRNWRDEEVIFALVNPDSFFKFPDGTVGVRKEMA